MIVSLVVLLIIVVVAKLIIDELGLAPNLKRAMMLLVALLAFLALVQILFGHGGAGWFRGLCP